MASGALTDLTAGPSDDIQAQLDAAGGSSSSVDAQLQSLKAQMAAGNTSPSLPSTTDEAGAPSEGA
jgi:phage shock protein A